MAARKDYRLLVIDVETTGLDVQNDFLLEVAVLVLDEDLQTVASYRSLVTEAASYDALLLQLNPVTRVMHAENGLLADLKDEYAVESRRTAPADVEMALARFLMETGGDPGKMVMVGYSVQFDQAIVRRALPLLDWLCSYQLIDVGAVRRVLNLAGHKLKKRESEGAAHRALSDAHAAAEELRDLVKLVAVRPASP